jgi:dolichol-phosphate mannosyltransferase
MTDSGPVGRERASAPVAAPALSVVVPVCNEAENVEPLIREIALALGPVPHEIIYVDDGSTDDTAAVALRTRAAGVPQLRLLRHSRRSGQSAAVASGIRAARAEWVATLDGDGQNDPADLPALMAARDAQPSVRLIMGHRQSRRDTAWRRFQSRIANGFRSRMLGDGTPDTGCGIKLLHRPTFLTLPYFDHMHRFLPALYQRAGAPVVSVPVRHRARERGQSKYGMFDRLWVGIVDILGVMWLRRRFKPGLEVREEP